MNRIFARSPMWLLFFALAWMPTGCGGEKEPAVATTPVVLVGFDSLPPDLKATIEELERVESVRAEVTIEVPGGRKQEGYIEFKTPDLLHVDFNNSDFGVGNELTVIGRDYFVRFGAEWFPRTAPDMAVATPVPIKDLSLQVLRGGRTRVNGRQCDLYSFLAESDGTFDAAVTGTVEACIAENRVHRLVYKGPGVTITAIFHYDVEVNIEPPQ